MLALSVFEILIGKVSLKRVNEITIVSSWKNMTDTCSIKLPRNIKLGGQRITEIIKAGDPVTVKLGYDGKLREEFKGYLTRIKSTTPVELECEDEMWQLKKGSYTKSWANATLNDVLDYVLAGRSYKTFGTITLGKFTINKATPAKVLEEINKTYGLKSFFRKGVLVIGKVYDETAPEHKYHFQKNVVSNSLEYRSSDEVKVKVKAISILKDGRKIEKELGDSDGQERTLNFYELTGTELEKAAKVEMIKLKYDGYRGKMTAFGLPAAEHGDVAILQGTNTMLSIGEEPVNDHDGKYYIDAVTKTFSVSGGYRRELEIGVAADKALTKL